MGHFRLRNQDVFITLNSESCSVPMKQFEICQQINYIITATRAANVSQIKMYGKPRWLVCITGTSLLLPLLGP